MFCRTIMYQARATCSKHLRNKIQFRAYRTVEYRQCVHALSLSWEHHWAKQISRWKAAVDGDILRRKKYPSYCTSIDIYNPGHLLPRIFSTIHTRPSILPFTHPLGQKQKERKTTSNNRLRQATTAKDKQATKQQVSTWRK